jgi:long-chain acyl-CoA synthetase
MKITRTFDILESYRNDHIMEDALAAKKNKKWKKYSSQEYLENVKNFSLGLMSLGFKKGDKIATVSNNRPEWNIMDMGMSQIGVIHVSIYPTISLKEYEHIIQHCNAKILIVSGKIHYNKLIGLAEKLSNIEKVYTIERVENATNWSEILDAGKMNSGNETALETIKKSIQSSDLNSIIYTSGTTGMPKGVMLTHSNFVSNFMSAYPALPMEFGHKALSFLPLCHVYERMINYLMQYKGIAIYYAENMGTIIDNLKEIKADGFDTVPRLLERVFDTIMARGNNLKGMKKMLFFWAVNLGLKYEFNRANGWFYELKLKIANKLIFSKWRQALGGNIKFIGSGGAALQPRLARIFWAARIPVQEGYGLTETSPLIALNFPNYPHKKLGTVGVVLDGVEVKFGDDGEILCKGPNVMVGYYKDPELTKQAIDEDGWFHTGDIGEMIDGRYLKITDRKKEIFKLSSGKYIAPQVIENKCRESEYIEQIMVVGENEKFASALISPKFDLIQKWAKKKKIDFQSNKSLIQNPEIIKLFQKIVNEYNQTFGNAEKIKRFRLVPEEWTLETGELSPTLKLKRRFVYDKYEQFLEEIYGHLKNSNK